MMRPSHTSRTRAPRPVLALAALIAAAGLGSGPALAAQRAFVSAHGADGNAAAGCALASPCRTFAVALGAVDSGGEVVALDSGSYGAVTIAKSVSIIANPGVDAIIDAVSGDAGVVIAAPGIDAVLRNLRIVFRGATDGIYMTGASNLTVQDCLIGDFVGRGIEVFAAAKVRVMDTVIRNNVTGITLRGGASAEIIDTRVLGIPGGWGVFVDGNIASTETRAIIVRSLISAGTIGILSGATASGATTRLVVRDSTIAHNDGEGIKFTGPGSATVSATLVTDNLVGLVSDGGMESLGDNTVLRNTTDISGTVVSTPPL